jgi:hypothetical protein
MTWFGWFLLVYWTIVSLTNLYVAGRVRDVKVATGEWKAGRLSHGGLIFGSIITIVLMILTLTVGTGYGLIS